MATPVDQITLRDLLLLLDYFQQLQNQIEANQVKSLRLQAALQKLARIIAAQERAHLKQAQHAHYLQQEASIQQASKKKQEQLEQEQPHVALQLLLDAIASALRAVLINHPAIQQLQTNCLNRINALPAQYTQRTRQILTNTTNRVITANRLQQHIQAVLSGATSAVLDLPAKIKEQGAAAAQKVEEIAAKLKERVTQAPSAVVPQPTPTSRRTNEQKDEVTEQFVQRVSDRLYDDIYTCVAAEHLALGGCYDDRLIAEMAQLDELAMALNLVFDRGEINNSLFHLLDQLAVPNLQMVRGYETRAAHQLQILTPSVLSALYGQGLFAVPASGYATELAKGNVAGLTNKIK